MAQARKETEADKLADELYLATLSRLPSAEEKGEVAAHLMGKPDRAVAVGQYVWALLTSTVDPTELVAGAGAAAIAATVFEVIRERGSPRARPVQSPPRLLATFAT